MYILGIILISTSFVFIILYTNLFTIKDNGTVIASNYRDANGLVSFVQSDTSVNSTTNWDTILVPGCYKVQMSGWGDAASYHGPNETQSNLYSYGLLFVMRGTTSDSESRTLQIYFPHRADASNPIYCRMRNGADTSAHSTWQTWHVLTRGAASSDHNHNNVYVKLDGSNTMTGSLKIKPATGEGGEIALQASTAETTKAGITIDNYYGAFRIFGIASADGTTVTGTGTPLVIDPYAKTITGGYTITGTLSGNASSATTVKVNSAATTKSWITGTSSTLGSTSATINADSLVYLTTTAGEVSAKKYSINDGASTPAEKVRMEWNATDLSLDFIFV